MSVSLSKEELDALFNTGVAKKNSLHQVESFLKTLFPSYSQALQGIEAELAPSWTLSSCTLETHVQARETLTSPVIVASHQFSGDVKGQHNYLFNPSDLVRLSPHFAKEGTALSGEEAFPLLEKISTSLNQVLTLAAKKDLGADITFSPFTIEEHHQEDLEISPNILRVKYALKIEDEDFFIEELFDESFLELWLPTEEEVSQSEFQEEIGQVQRPAQGEMMSKMNTGPVVQGVEFPNLSEGGMAKGTGNINLLMDVPMEVTVELGRARRLIKDILDMGEGTIISLDKLAGEPVDILVNGKLIARGEVVVIDENFGVRVTEILSLKENLFADLG